MELLRKIIYRLTHLHIYLTAICVLISVGLFLLLFSSFNFDAGFYIFLVIFSIYTIINVLIPLPDHVYKAKSLIYKNKFITRYIYDYEYRSNINLQIGFLGNAIYSLINLFLGFMTGTAWFWTLGIFYAIYGFLKFAIIARQQHIFKYESMRERRATALRTWRFIGFSILITAIPMTVMIVEMIYLNKNLHYHYIITFGIFVYTVIFVVSAIVKMFQSKLRNNPIFTAYSNLCLCSALIALLSLQTTLLTAFNVEESKRILFNSISGAVVVSVFFIISIYVTVKTTKILNQNYSEFRTYFNHKEYEENRKNIFDIKEETANEINPK